MGTLRSMIVRKREERLLIARLLETDPAFRRIFRLNRAVAYLAGAWLWSMLAFMDGNKEMLGAGMVVNLVALGYADRVQRKILDSYLAERKEQ